MAKDPVCGMEIDENRTPHKSRYLDETYFFCSGSCKTQFENYPEKYFLETLRQAQYDQRKIAVIGAGQVGAAFSFALMTSSLSSNFVLIDNDFERAEGHVMDLNHGLSFVQPSRISAGDFSDCRNSEIVVVTAGTAQKKGETTLDLVKKNIKLFKDIIPKVAEQHDI